MKIVLIGDSIRMGYQELVRQRVAPRAEVWGPDENCGHTLMIRDNLVQWAIAPEPDVLHFNSGIWDLGWDAGTQAPRMTIRAYVRNLKLIVRALQERTRARLIFATTTPFLKPMSANVPRERCVVAPVVARYNGAAVELMHEFAVEINDLYGTVMDAGVHECLGEDRLHMAPRGNEVLAEAVARSVLG